jgi:putative transposase
VAGGEPSEGEPSPVARRLAEELLDDRRLDELIDAAGAGQLRLTGEGGFLPELLKRVLERGLAAELTDHLGYERGDAAGRGAPNSRNGSTGKTLFTEVGEVPLQVPGTGRPRSSRGWCRSVPGGWPAASTR